MMVTSMVGGLLFVILQGTENLIVVPNYYLYLGYLGNHERSYLWVGYGMLDCYKP